MEVQEEGMGVEEKFVSKIRHETLNYLDNF